MKAVLIDHFGGADAYRIAEAPVPELGPGQVLIRVACAGVNPADFKEREGQLDMVFAARPRPYVAGNDAAGVVERVGAGVTQFKPGDRVVSPSAHLFGEGGSFAEFLRVGEENVGPMPKTLSFAEAAAMPVAACTAFQAALAPEKGALKAGDTLLMHGGAGGLGSYAVQFAKAVGARVAATCRTENVDYLRGLGADCVIDYRKTAIAEALKAWTPGGVDVIIDAVGADTLADPIALLKRGGRYVQIPTATVDGDIAATAAAAEAAGCTHVFKIMDFGNGPADFARIAEFVDAGKVRPPAIRVFPMEEARAAVDLVGGQHVQGKLVLKIADIA